MTKEELKKATGQALIEERDYCGVDGYYGDYLDNVNAEILKRLNRLAELEKENAELKEQIEKMKCCGNCSHRCYWGNELNCKLDLDKQFECDNNNKKYWEFREE